jgi:outer membrane protein TolC
VKGQQLFHSFLPSVTAAVLTTQPSWAQTINIGEVGHVGSPRVATSTNEGNQIANNIKTQLPTTITPARTITESITSLDNLSLSTGKTSTPKSALLDLTATTLPLSAVSPSAVSPSASHKKPETQLLTVSQMPARTVGAARLLADQPLCPTQQTKISKTLACPSQKTTSGNWLAQANTPTPTVPTKPVPPTNLTPTKPGSSVSPTNNPNTPTTTPPPSDQIPIVPKTKPTNAGLSVSVPEYLNPSPNPLKFPTKPDEVRLRGTQPITLAQALELARRNSQDLQIALLSLERSKYALRQAQASLYPTFSLNAGVTRSQSPAAQRNPITGQVVQSSATSGFTGGAQLNYNLYTSGQRLANIGIAEENLRTAELEVERISDQIRLNVTTGYYNLQSADEQVRIQQAAVANGLASLRDAQALERAGVGTRFETLQAQVTLANDQQNLVSAQAQQQINRRQLAQLLNLTQVADISAADPVELAGLWNYTLEQSIVLAFQNRPELQEQLAQRNISEQQRRLALSQLGPQISLNASYQLQDVFDDNINASSGYSIGVNASVNLFDGGAARASAAQQRINIRIAESQFANQRNQVRFQVEQFYFQLQSNQQNVQTATVAVTEAREALRLARLRFQAGVGTQTDVINQEAALTQSEGLRVSAIINYNIALASLQQAVSSRALR